MRILVLGASGMLGHMLFAELLRRGFDVWGSARRPFACKPAWRARLRFGLDACQPATVSAVLDDVKPDVVVNAVGLIRQLPEGKQALPCLRLNAVFPWELQEMCAQRGIRLIHYSTDCVFDGGKGQPYSEEDEPTARDMYGRTKFLGEVHATNTLIIRTSIIGPELRGKHSLLGWFLAQTGVIRGYTGAIYSGLTSSEQAMVLAKYLLPHSELSGLYHVSGWPISKYDLLLLLKNIYQKELVIEPDKSVKEDKRLSCVKFHNLTNYVAPEWPIMLNTMYDVHKKNMLDFA